VELLNDCLCSSVLETPTGPEFPVSARLTKLYPFSLSFFSTSTSFNKASFSVNPSNIILDSKTPLFSLIRFVASFIFELKLISNEIKQ
jgi:hypothetical protein